MRTSSRNLAVLLFDEVELWDVASVMHVTALAGRHWNWRPFRLTTAAVAPGLIQTRSQVRLEAAFGLDSCPAPEILFVPGGYGARLAARDPRITEWCGTAARAADLTLASGAGVAVLGAAGLLAGSTVAAATDAVDWMREALPNTTLDAGDGVVSSAIDGVPNKLLTIASGAHGIELALRVVERFLGARMARQLAASLALPQIARIDLPPAPKITKPTP